MNSPDDGSRYEIGEQVYTYDELRQVTEAEVKDLAPETFYHATTLHLPYSMRRGTRRLRSLY